MIVTLTLNPSLDRTIEVDRLERGSMIRATSARLDPGGKGVNVARALLANQVPTCAVVAAGGAEGDQLIQLLRGEGIPVREVRVTGRTRSNVTIVEPGGVVTKLNEPGEQLSRRELDTITEAVSASAKRARWVVACGSLPPGVPDDFYAELCRGLSPGATRPEPASCAVRPVSTAYPAHDTPAVPAVPAAGDGGPEPRLRFAVDTSGPALLSAIAAGPDLIKPNREELAEAIGRPVRCLRDVVDAAEQLRDLGASAVLASLGADGAVLVDADGAVFGEVEVTRPRSTVGAGDALLAGFLAAGAHGPDALAEGLAWGAAAVRLPASRMPAPGDIQRGVVRILKQPELSRPLRA